MEQHKMTITSTPHVRENTNTRKIMLDVLIALLPACLMSIYYFGIGAFFTITVSVISCIFFEWAYERLMKREITIRDLSAAVTGVLLAMNLPSETNMAIPIVGSFFAIIVIKQLFGGLGHNFMNPALGARAFLILSYPAPMIDFKEPVRNLFNIGRAVDALSSPTLVDAVSSPTPLVLLETGSIPSKIDYINAFIGYTKGSLGETCAFALILGGVYLLYRNIITWRIPITYIGTVILLSWIFGAQGFFNGYPVYEVLVGGLLLGAFFMATDYTTSPVTKQGQVIMGLGCGIMTVMIRRYGAYPEGVSFAILMMNLATPLIDRFVRPRVFGHKRKSLFRKMA